MLKRMLASCALVLVMAVPAVAADNNGVYVGLKFIDSISSTGTTSKAASFLGEYTNNTVGGGVFVGYDFYPQHEFPIRAEIEYALRTNSSKSKSDSYGDSFDYGGKEELKIDTNIQTLMANVYFDIHNSTAFTPYIGAGLGMAFINTKVDYSDNWNDRQGAGAGTMTYGSTSVSANKTNTVFAWNVGAGVSYAFNDTVSADLGYRFVGLGENSISLAGADYKTHPYMNEVSLGVRFTF